MIEEILLLMSDRRIVQDEALTVVRGCPRQVLSQATAIGELANLKLLDLGLLREVRGKQSHSHHLCHVKEEHRLKVEGFRLRPSSGE